MENFVYRQIWNCENKLRPINEFIDQYLIYKLYKHTHLHFTRSRETIRRRLQSESNTTIMELDLFLANINANSLKLFPTFNDFPIRITRHACNSIKWVTIININSRFWELARS